MDLTTLQPLLHWISTHPGWSGLTVFLIAFSESLLLVGLIFPGSVIMFGVGTLVATGALDLWETLIWAAAGAIAGDGVSFWLGRHYKDRLRGMWPIRRYPGLMERGEQFFNRHGGKSILFGRFVGPVRPVIPAVAGMLGMPPARFVTVNVVSGIAWAPAYTLPGVVLGASLGIASEIASRLVLLALTTAVVLWLSAWLVYRIYLYLQRRGAEIIQRLLTWGATHRYAGRVVSSVLDPEQSEARGLAVLAAALICLALLLVTVGHRLFNDQITLANNTLFQALQGLRVQWADHLMVFVAELGSGPVLFSVTVAVSVWLAWRRIWLALLHCIGAAGFAVALTLALDWSRNAPLNHLHDTWASAPAVMSTMLYGLLAVMITQGHRGVRRWIPYVLAGMVIAAINLSQLYLGAAWLSQVVAGAVLALLWVVILGTAYRLHATIPVAPRTLIVIVLTTLVFATGIQQGIRYGRDLARYAPQRSIIPLTAAAWWDTAWRTLPTYRIDLVGRGEQPLTVQWSGPLTELSDRLKQQGWREPPPLTGRSILQWLRPAPVLSDLPLLPQAHDGRYDILRLVHAGGDSRILTVLRLWSSNYTLRDSGNPLWIGSVTQVHASTPMPWLTVPITGRDFDEPLKTLQTSLTGLEWKVVQRPMEANMPWSGQVVLIRVEPGNH